MSELRSRFQKQVPNFLTFTSALKWIKDVTWLSKESAYMSKYRSWKPILVYVLEENPSGCDLKLTKYISESLRRSAGGGTEIDTQSLSLISFLNQAIDDMKHTERGVKMTGLPGRFGFTLLISQISKQSTVLLYICKEQQFFFFPWVLHLASAPHFSNYCLQKIKTKQKPNCDPKHYVLLSMFRKKWVLLAAIREHCEFQTGKQISDGFQLPDWVVKCSLPVNMWF